MNRHIQLQKDVFRRILKLHALRAADENLDLLSLALDDAIVFELAYRNIIDRVAASSSIGLRVDPDEGEAELQNCCELLHWLSENRAEILIEIHAIVSDLGGIEIADYLTNEVAAAF